MKVNHCEKKVNDIFIDVKLPSMKFTATFECHLFVDKENGIY